MAQDIVITEKDKVLMDEALATFIKDSTSRMALLVDKRGFIMAKKGDLSGTDTQTLAVLAMGSFASAQALAKVIGEDGFFGVFHQGKLNSVHISVICNWAMLVAVHDVSVTESVLRLSARETSKKLEPIIYAIVERLRTGR
jgi:predicted regulator of Ras-like GTPase activity (Roadblock/LC7/MglB family)